MRVLRSLTSTRCMNGFCTSNFAKKSLRGKLETQRLLVPEPVQLSPSECAAALEAKDEFAEIGVEIEAFGGDTVLITGYPAMLANHSPAELLRQMIEQCIAGTTPERRDTIDSLMHMISCKAAIKAGDKLTPEGSNGFAGKSGFMSRFASLSARPANSIDIFA